MASRNRMIIALMEEYRKAAQELDDILVDISKEEFIVIKDPNTKDKDCVSMQSIMYHVIRSGYSYANYVSSFTSDRYRKPELFIDNPQKAIAELEQMLEYTEQSMIDLWPMSNNEIDTYSIMTKWEVEYNFEQMMEHAIVHILRHRRQIENFMNL